MQITTWVATEISSRSGKSHHISEVCHMLDIAQCCLALNNFNSFAALLYGMMQATDKYRKQVMVHYLYPLIP